MSWIAIHVFDKTGLSDHIVVKIDAQNNQSARIHMKRTKSKTYIFTSTMFYTAK